MRKKVSDSMTFACTCSARINESETFVFVYVFMQSDDSRFRGQRPHTSLSRHEEQPLKPTKPLKPAKPLNLAMPRASTSAAADEVKHLYLLFCCITA